VKLKGLLFGLGGIALLMTSFLVLIVDERSLIQILRVLSSIGLLIISSLMLIIAWKLLTMRPAPPAS
jgi:CHASE2 domain-containing sensor protein